MYHVHEANIHVWEVRRLDPMAHLRIDGRCEVPLHTTHGGNATSVLGGLALLRYDIRMWTESLSARKNITITRKNITITRIIYNISGIGIMGH